MGRFETALHNDKEGFQNRHLISILCQNSYRNENKIPQVISVPS